MLYRYDPSLVSNSRAEICCFVTGVADLVREECCKAMLHNDMNLDRLMMYVHLIEELKLRTMSRNMKKKVLVTKRNLGLRRGPKLKKNLKVLW